MSNTPILSEMTLSGPNGGVFCLKVWANPGPCPQCGLLMSRAWVFYADARSGRHRIICCERCAK